MRLSPGRARSLVSPYHTLCRSTLLIALCLSTSFAVAIATAAATASADEQKFSARDIAKLELVTAAEISPDGQRVAYVVAVPRDPFEEDNGPPWTELHVVDREGQSRGFVTGKVNVSEVRWTPDGKYIAFITRRGDDKHNALYLIPADGGEARRAVKLETAVSGYDIHPDGKRAAVLAAEAHDKQVQEFRQKGFNQEVYEEDWKPTRVWIASLEEDTDEKPKALELPGHASFVQYNSSGDSLVVVLAPTALVDDSYMFKRVRVVDAESGRITLRIENPGKLGQVAWSPNGRHIAMVSAVDINDPMEGRLMVVDTNVDESDEVELRDLMSDYEESHVQNFRWIGDDRIVWLAHEGSLARVGTVNLDGRKTSLFGPSTPIFSNISASQDGSQLALVGNTERHPNEVFLMPLGRRNDNRDDNRDNNRDNDNRENNEPRRLTNSNPWLEQRRFAEQEVITYRASDGLEIEGIVVYPLDYEEGRRYPMIMVVHGGPEAHVSHGWVTSYSNPGQLGAARGFVVFYPNYRGSTGRGVEFTKMGQADAAGKEFDDLVDGVDYLVERGLVDKDRVGITGGSYGGYASAWGATYYSDRFAASVMFVGISNNVSKMGTTDIPEEMYYVHHLKRLWEDWDYFFERSPIKYIDRHRTPILIMHGKDDPRVDVSQSLELYRHLKTLDQAPVRMVLYPGEGHGNRRAAARFDYTLRLMQWMEHFLLERSDEPPPFAIDYREHWKPESRDDNDENHDENRDENRNRDRDR